MILTLVIQCIRASLAVIYGPNEDNPSFYNMVSEAISNFKNDNVILVGDFNLVLNPDKEKISAY